MTLIEYLETILTKKQIKELTKAIFEKKTIIVSGKQGTTGKSTLAKVLLKNGIPTIEGYQTFKICLDEPLCNRIPNFSDQVT